MEWLNYHHLLYFWMVAKEGSVTAAAAALRLSQPTISGQVKMLEEALGEKLFRRVGRHLELTEMGKVAYRYADEIFTLGREMQDLFAGRKVHHPEKLTVGVSDLLPKLVLHRDDGRNFLLSSDERWDVITSDPIWVTAVLAGLIVAAEWLIFLSLALVIMQKAQLRFGKA